LFGEISTFLKKYFGISRGFRNVKKKNWKCFWLNAIPNPHVPLELPAIGTYITDYVVSHHNLFFPESSSVKTRSIKIIFPTTEYVSFQMRIPVSYKLCTIDGSSTVFDWKVSKKNVVKGSKVFF
jgi:hypothetical protein